MKHTVALACVAVNVLLLLANLSMPAWAQQVGQLFTFTTRTAIPFPVAVMRPTTPGQVAAIDVTPSAGASAHPDNGFAWFDACDADILFADGGVPVTCARLGIKPDGVEMGSRSFDGASAKPVYIIVNRQRVARFDADGLTVYGAVRAQKFAN